MLAATLCAQVADKPDGWVQDEAKVLDTGRTESLQERINQTHEATGITVYVVTYESLAETELASSRAAQLLGAWSDADLAGVMVYVASPPRLAVATTRAATLGDEDGALRSIAQRANTRLDAAGNPAQILRESALELDYVLRSIHREEQASFFTKYPLRLLITVAVVLVALLLLLLGFGQAKHHNLFGRVVTFPEQPATQRLGGNRTGGHSAVRSFKD